MHHLDERYFIERIQQGDTEAFNPLVRKYQPRVYTHTLGRVIGPEVAKDLTQETWIKAFRAINSFCGESSFYSCLYRIAENVCIDHYRKQRASHVTEVIQGIDECRITETHSCPSEDIERQEL